jgi:hypothetical protein
MKRTIVWIDSADEETHKVRERLKEYLTKAGLRYTLFDVCEVMEKETE